MKIAIYTMIYAGSALMVFNIWRYIVYIKNVTRRSDWSSQRIVLQVPLVLLIGFLAGYLAVGIFGRPDLIISGILFGGSIFVAIIVNMLDRVTTHIQQTEQLEARLMAAEDSSRAKTAFLSNMSHEIRTPMNAIIGIDAIALKDEDLKAETREQLLKIDASARHLLGLINDILDMSRIESGQMELREEPLSMDGLITQVSSIIQSQCDEKGLEFVTEIHGRSESAEAGGPCCMGDETKLRQVLINILGNAVKFTEAPGAVSFITEAENCSACKSGCDEGCHVRFTIKDTGEGIDEAFLPKIFDSFAQEDATTTNRYGGSGLGMAITKSLVDMMGGTIKVESKKGEGTAFTVEVDLKPLIAGAKEPAGVTAEAVGAEGANLAGRRVLFAEDVEINAEILSDLLEMEGIEADWAENGKIAVEKFAQAPEGYYDAVLMDMRMPVMDGLEATRAIRYMDSSDAKNIPIIALTANAFDDDVRRCLESGMDAHLSKPVDTERLVALLGGLISESERRKTAK